MFALLRGLFFGSLALMALIPVGVLLATIGLPVALALGLLGATFGVMVAFLAVGVVAIKIAFIVLAPLLVLGWMVRRVFGAAGDARIGA
jgi:hypothetical protein